MSFTIVQFRFLISVKENLKIKWQCSQYLDLNPTCPKVEIIVLESKCHKIGSPDANNRIITTDIRLSHRIITVICQLFLCE